MFVFSLAQELGMTVRELGERMDSDELTYWQMYSELRKEMTDAAISDERNRQAVRR